LFCITTTLFVIQEQKLLQKALLQELHTYGAFFNMETVPQRVALFNELYSLVISTVSGTEGLSKIGDAPLGSVEEALAARNAIRVALKVSTAKLTSGPIEYYTVVVQHLFNPVVHYAIACATHYYFHWVHSEHLLLSEALLKHAVQLNACLLMYACSMLLWKYLAVYRA
jgi:hypothetical protein